MIPLTTAVSSIVTTAWPLFLTLVLLRLYTALSTVLVAPYLLAALTKTWREDQRYTSSTGDYSQGRPWERGGPTALPRMSSALWTQLLRIGCLKHLLNETSLGLAQLESNCGSQATIWNTSNITQGLPLTSVSVSGI